MALRVWLPLNGNLNNQGLGSLNTSFTTSSGVWEAGKIGNNLYLGNTLTNTVTINELVGVRNLTCAFWYKLKNNSSITTYADVISLGVRRISAPTTTALYRLEVHTSGSKNTWYGNGVVTDSGGSGTTNASEGIWHHMAFTTNGETVWFYLDGVQYSTFTHSTYKNDFEFTGTLRLGDSGMYVSLADVRVYDEVLSPKQVKEISKGLVAHYKLNTARAINNLKRNASYGTYNNFSSSGSTCTVVDTGTTYQGAKIYRMTYTPNDTSLSSVQTTLHSHGVTTSGQTFTAETKYCYWTLCKPISHPDTVVGGVASNIGYWYEIPMKEYENGWYIVGQKRTGNAPENKSDTIYTSFKTPSATSGTPIIIDFCCPHLVEGYDEILPEFDYQGTVVTQEQDCSGNGYTAKVTGSLTFNPDSARYNGSTTFPGNCANYLYRPYFSFLTGPLTFNCWVYQTAASPATQFIMSQGRDNTCNGFNLSTANGIPKLWAGGEDKIQIVGTTSIVDNKWHMLTGTWDGATAKLYVDGTLIGSTAMGDITYTQANNGFVIGKMAYSYTSTANYFPFVGSVSDAKVYATALFADDILTMYKNSGIIDNKDNVYAYEFKENKNNIAWRANNSIIKKEWANGLAKVTQANVSCTLENEGIRIVRTPNIPSADHNMWGGFCWRLRTDAVKDILTKGHSYIILYDVKGKTNQSQFTGWDNNMGWGGGGLSPAPTNVQYRAIPANFESNEWQTFFYKWDLTDDVYKVCTSSYSSFVAGNTYLSYSDFQIGWSYGDTGEWGTDIYIKNIRMYDITDVNKPQLIKTGIFTIDGIHENNKTRVRQSEIEANNFIEL